MKKRALVIVSVLLGIVMLLALLVGCTPQVGSDVAESIDQYYDETYGNYTITVYLVIGNPDPEKEPLFSGKVTLKTIKHMAYEAVEAACTSKSIEVVGLNGYSSFITSIAGVGYKDNGDGTFSSWSTAVNEGWSAGLGAQQLRDGDLFTVTYETQAKTW